MNEQHWYKKAKIGIFYHWGIENGRTAEEFEALTNGWNAKEWIDAAKKHHAQYVTLATFHSVFSWLITWKSDIPGLQKTKRDFLAELIEEANKAGIKVIVYITSATPGLYGEHVKNCVNFDKYAKYKGLDGIDSKSFLEFQGILAKEIILELMDKYPDVAGFWYDGWNDKDVCEDVFAAVHAKNPEVINIRNNFYKEPYKDEDVMSQECLGKVCSPYYDKASASWVESDIPAEWAYIPFGQWDTVGEHTPRPCKITDEIKSLTSIMANGWVAKVGLAAQTNGVLDDFQHEYLDAVDEYLSWAEEAFTDTRAGGFTGGEWNRGAYGFTTQKTDSNEYYICVTTAPMNGGDLTLVNNGFEVKSVSDLKTGKTVEFVSENGLIKIKCNDWSDVYKIGAMIFKVTADKKETLCSIEPDSEMELPGQILIELDENKSYSGIEVVHSEASAVAFGAWGGQSSQRPKEYRISDADTNEVLASGIFKNQRGTKWISLEGICAKHIKLEFLSGYNTYKKPFAAVWSGGWKMKINDAVDACSDADGTVHYINSANELWERTGMGDRKLRKGIKRVVCGGDNKFYYIDLNDNVIGLQHELKAKDLTALSDGTVYYVSLDGDLMKLGSNNVILKNVRSITVAANDVVFIAADTTYMLIKDELSRHVIPYNTVSVAANKKTSDLHAGVFVVTPTGKIHFVNQRGDNSYIAGYDAERVNSGMDGMVWHIASVKNGNVNIKNINLIKK